MRCNHLALLLIYFTNLLIKIQSISWLKHHINTGLSASKAKIRWIKNNLFQLRRNLREKAQSHNKVIPKQQVCANSQLTDNGHLLLMPPIALFILSSNAALASPFDPQTVIVRGPFFQGWLFRTVDHHQGISFIVIVGAFSSDGCSGFDSHYLYCGAQIRDHRVHEEVFPTAGTVIMTGGYSRSYSTALNPSSSFDSEGKVAVRNQKLDMTWNSKFGQFIIKNNTCEGNFKVNSLSIHFNTTSRVPWSKEDPNTDGPEGWLRHTSLLPCHYFIYSTGSVCNYQLEIKHTQNAPLLKSISTDSLRNYSGIGYLHSEGNYGTFFPSGWMWVQAVQPDNNASLSIVLGRFTIGPLSPLNCVIYFRHGNKSHIFRSTDFDRFTYKMDGVKGQSIVVGTKMLGNGKIEVELVPHDTVNSLAFGDRNIFIPTSNGFSDSPGCRECYVAMAKVRYWEFDVFNCRYELLAVVDFPLTALEYGAAFQGLVLEKS